MSVECAEQVLSADYPKVLSEVYIEVLAGVSPSKVSLIVMPPCFEEVLNVSLNIGEKKELICPFYNQYYWSIEYLEYFSPYAARIEICKELTVESPPEEPPVEDEGGLFNWIFTALTAVIHDVRDTIIFAIDEPINTINGIKTSLTGLLWSIEDVKDDLIEDSLNRFDVVKDQITELDIPSLDSITDRLNPIKMQITAIEIPTVDNIKDGFLSLTSDFADGIWNRILDKIEERYNK